MNGDMIGRIIKERYKLIDERGRGSFATVYVARDTKDNHIYAVKMMHVELSNDEEVLARFQREADILLHLDDPHIVQVVDYGEDNSMHFIVMDYIDGQNMKYYTLTGGPMEPMLALNYAQQIAEGLVTAHQHGVVHRDIKPQNILIDTKGVVKITDFGLARSREAVTLTQSNVFMGTAYYISPEQAESGRAADIRSDLYSVAAVLFEMLTGHPPFEGETAVDIVMKHMHDKVPSLSRLRPELPGDVDVFMQKALAKSPNDRYSTPREFVAALEQLQQRMPSVPAQPPESMAGAIQRVPASQQKSGGGSTKRKSPMYRGEETPQKQAYIVILSSGQAIPLAGELMVVGRQDPTLGIYPEINLADKTVGRRHAYLRNQQGQFTVEDLNALNKTRLNGITLAPYEERTLNDGDILRFGSVEVRFELR